jgi:hypothetical protein
MLFSYMFCFNSMRQLEVLTNLSSCMCWNQHVMSGPLSTRHNTSYFTAHKDYLL